MNQLSTISFALEWAMMELGELMLTLAHIINTPVYCYDTTAPHHIWAAYFPNAVDRCIPRDVRQKSLYLYLPMTIFMVITAINT